MSKTTKNGLSPIGKELEKLRIDTDMSVGEFAESIGMTQTGYSAMCRFRRDVDRMAVSSAISLYAKDDLHAENIANAAEISVRRIVLNTANMTDAERATAIALMRKHGNGFADSEEFGDSDGGADDGEGAEAA
jgi:hypothetical protein